MGNRGRRDAQVNSAFGERGTFHPLQQTFSGEATPHKSPAACITIDMDDVQEPALSNPVEPRNKNRINTGSASSNEQRGLRAVAQIMSRDETAWMDA